LPSGCNEKRYEVKESISYTNKQTKERCAEKIYYQRKKFKLHFLFVFNPQTASILVTQYLSRLVRQSALYADGRGVDPHISPGKQSNLLHSVAGKFTARGSLVMFNNVLIKKLLFDFTG
jgi:hypothetical protein